MKQRILTSEMKMVLNRSFKIVLAVLFWSCGNSLAFSKNNDSAAVSKKNPAGPAETYSNLVKQYLVNDPEKAVVYGKKARILYSNSKDEPGEAKADYFIAVGYKGLAAFDSALFYYNESYTKRIHCKADYASVAEAKNGEAIIYSMEAKYDQALTIFMETEKIFEGKSDSAGIAKELNNIGNIYYSVNQSDKALLYFKRTLGIKERHHLTSLLDAAYLNIADIYNEKKQSDSAKYYLDKALKLAEELDDQPDISRVYYELSELYNNQDKFELAISSIKKSLAIREEIRDDYGIAECLLDLGRYYSSLDNFKEAISNYKKALEYSQETGSTQQLSELNDLISGAYMASGDFKNAYTFLRQHINYRDSVVDETRAKRIAELQEKYDVQEKEKNIEILRAEKANQEIELYKKKIQVNYILGISIVVILIIILLYFRYSSKQKNNSIRRELALNTERINAIEERRILQEKQQKELLNTFINAQEEERRKIALDLHDGLGQLLSGIKLNLHLAFNDKNMPAETEKLLKNVQQLNNESISESKNIASNLLPYNIKDFGLVAAIKNLCYNNNQLKISTISFYSNDVPRKLPGELEIAVYRITQELINNALKHAKASEIFVQLFYRENKLILQIEDNGIGFVEAESKNKLNSMGLKNIANRVKLLDGHVEIDSVLNKGTTALIEFPLSL